MTSRICPSCGSDRVRRGGTAVWGVYVFSVLLAVPAVLWLHLHAGLVAGVMLAVFVIAHLVLDAWWCADCGHQWRH
jgi:hypothetical protein